MPSIAVRVLKENLSRSVLQVVKSIGDDDSLTVNLRHTKSNVGPRQDEASVRLSFSEGIACREAR